MLMTEGGLMPGRKPARNEKIRQALEKLVAGHPTGQPKAQRARIILKAADGKNQSEIAKGLKISVDMAALGRERWLALEGIGWDAWSVEARLEDLPRPGAPSRLSADQLCQIEPMACEASEKVGRPISQWTGREIADALMNRGIVDSISRRHAARLLKKGDSHRT